MSRKRRNETEEQRARRELISDFLSAANIQSIYDVLSYNRQNRFEFLKRDRETPCARRVIVL